MQMLTALFSAATMSSLEEHQHQINHIYEKRHNIPRRYKHVSDHFLTISARENKLVERGFL